MMFFYPDMPWKMQYVIEYISFFSTITVGILYLSHIFPRHANKRINNIFITITLLYITITVFGNSYFISKLIFPYEFVIIAGLVYMFVILFKALLKERKKAIFILVGFSAQKAY